MSNWFEVEILCNREGFDAVTGCLLRLDINGFEISDSEEFTAFTQDKDASWDYIDDKLLEEKNSQDSVKCYLPDNEQGRGQLELVRQEMKSLKERDDDDTFGSLEIKVSQVREEDWANNWKQYFKPFAVGKSLIVKPSWEESDPEWKDMVVIEIDPGSSFGTGQHETTKMCLDFLDMLVRPGDKMLDLGCGSGILSIAAKKLGASSVTAVDIDENSVNIARENYLNNGLDESALTTYVGNVIDDEQLREKIGTGYRIVCANIVADVLIGMSSFIEKFMSDDGWLIISGIIEERMYEVFDKMVANGLKLIWHDTLNGWVAARLVSERDPDSIKRHEYAMLSEEEGRQLLAEQSGE